MTVTNVGTPDWQRGTVGAGKILASLPSTTTTTRVDVPANAQTLVIVDKGGTSITALVVSGVSTNMEYPGMVRTFPAGLGNGNLYLFTVLPGLDSQVDVQVSPGFLGQWYIYSMTATALIDVAELSGIVQPTWTVLNGVTVPTGGWDGSHYEVFSCDSNGRQVPLVPTSSSGAVVLSATGVQVLAAKAAGHNYLFGVDLTNTSGAAVAMSLTIGGVAITSVEVPTGASVTVRLDGYVTNAIVTGVGAAAGTTATLRYAAGP